MSAVCHRWTCLCLLLLPPCFYAPPPAALLYHHPRSSRMPSATMLLASRLGSKSSKPCRQEFRKRLRPPMHCFAMSSAPAVPATLAQLTGPISMPLRLWLGSLGISTLPRGEWHSRLQGGGWGGLRLHHNRQLLWCRCHGSSANHRRRWLASLVAAADAVGIPACASLASIDEATGRAIKLEQVHTGGAD